jgi:hypothetical protein
VAIVGVTRIGMHTAKIAASGLSHAMMCGLASSAPRIVKPWLDLRQSQSASPRRDRILTSNAAPVAIWTPCGRMRRQSGNVPSTIVVEAERQALSMLQVHNVTILHCVKLTTLL